MKTQEIKLNSEVVIDLPKFISSKMLLQANTGYGKSWAIRRILEQSFGKIQQIVLDTEGEFATLREKFDYILVGKDYDIAADPKTAALLAHRLLEEKVSAIIDLYELEPWNRELFVANFLTACVNMPKKLYHPCLLVIDEAHEYAPEAGNSPASRPMHLLASKGRKRGLCPIFATQRISALSKNVVASCNNKLIGQASLDLDIKRAAAELGFTSKEQQLSLRNLDPGEFYAFGSAISKEIIKLKIGSIQTSHPDSTKIGAHIAAYKVAPASEKVKKALAKLADLPKEAEQEATTLADLKQQVKTLTSKLQNQIPADHLTKDAIVRALKLKDQDFAEERAHYKKEFERITIEHNANVKFIEATYKLLKQIEKLAGSMGVQDKSITVRTIPMQYSMTDKRPRVRELMIAGNGLKMPSQKEIDTVHFPPPVDDNGKLAEGERSVLIAIAQHDNGITREHITVITQYKRSTRDAYINRLQQKSLVRAALGKIYATELGIERLGDDFEPLPIGEELRTYLLRTLPEGEQKILGHLMQSYPTPLSRNEITEKTGYSRSTRDAYLNRLTNRVLVISEGRGMVKAADKLFE